MALSTALPEQHSGVRARVEAAVFRFVWRLITATVVPVLGVVVQALTKDSFGPKPMTR